MMSLAGGANQRAVRTLNKVDTMQKVSCATANKQMYEFR